MISAQKKYLIDLFLKRCSTQSINKDYIDSYFNILKTTYDISKENEQRLKEKYSLDEYVKRIIPVIDSFFTEEDLKIAIKFFSSGVGEKLLNMDFLKSMGSMRQEMLIEMEQEFAKTI